MIHDLIVYYLENNALHQGQILDNIKELLNTLNRQGIDTNLFRVVDGNKFYRATFVVVDKVIKYCAKNYPILPTYNIYQSFLVLERYLSKNDITGYDYFTKNHDLLPPDSQKRIFEDLIRLVDEDTPPLFFNAIILTGNLYRLGYPYGVAIKDVAQQGICLNANTHKQSLWHETAHLLGAQEHYDEQNDYRTINCADPADCFMQGDSLKGNRFCTTSLMEIHNHLQNCGRQHV